MLLKMSKKTVICVCNTVLYNMPSVLLVLNQGKIHRIENSASQAAACFFFPLDKVIPIERSLLLRSVGKVLLWLVARESTMTTRLHSTAKVSDSEGCSFWIKYTWSILQSIWWSFKQNFSLKVWTVTLKATVCPDDACVQRHSFNSWNTSFFSLKLPHKSLNVFFCISKITRFLPWSPKCCHVFHSTHSGKKETCTSCVTLHIKPGRKERTTSRWPGRGNAGH